MSTFWSGNTGVSTGAHLHFGVWDPKANAYIDPSPFTSLLESGGKPLLQRFPITSGFGPRQSPTAGASSNHRGVDIDLPEGTPVELRGGRWRGAWEDKGGGGVVGEYDFDTTDGRKLLARLMHGQPRNLQQPALVPGTLLASNEKPAASAAPAAAPTAAAAEPEYEERMVTRLAQDWREAAGASGRSTDPSSQAYWERGDIQQWAAANAQLAQQAMERAGADPAWLKPPAMETVTERVLARRPERGALNGVRVGGPPPVI